MGMAVISVRQDEPGCSAGVVTAALPFTGCETEVHRLTQGPGEEVEGKLFLSAVDSCTHSVLLPQK